MSVQNVPRRASLALRWLKQRKEDTIIVVTHGGVCISSFGFACTFDMLTGL